MKILKRNQYRPYVRAGVTALVVIALSILLFFTMLHLSTICDVLKHIKFILRPIFMGLILAFLLLPIHRHIYRFLTEKVLEPKKKTNKALGLMNGLSILLSLVFAFLVVYILLDMVIPQVYISIVGLLNSIPQYISNAEHWLLEFLEDNPEIQAAFISSYDTAATALQEWLNHEILPNLESFGTTLEWIRDSVLPNVTGVVSNVSALVIELLMLLKDLFIAVIVSVYLLARKDIFAAQSKKIVYSLFSPAHGDFIVEETRSAYKILSGFINGKLLDSLIIGIIALVCCSLFHFPYPVLLAAVIGVTNIIPFFGPFIGAVPCAILILMVSPLQCIYFIIFILVLQQFDGNILGPKILGESTGLASFWVLFSILFFGGIFGFAGMVLGVPFFAILYSLIRRLVYCGLRRHELPIETKVYLGPTGPMAKADQVGEPPKPEQED